MNFNAMWDWQGQEYCLEDFSSIEMSTSLFSGGSQSAEEHLSSIFDHENTPVRSCGDLAYNATKNKGVPGKKLELIDPSSQVKRRRMLQFESEVLDELLCNDEFLRSKEAKGSREDDICGMSQWVAEFSEGNWASSNKCLDPSSSEGWIDNCFNDAEMHFCSEDTNDISGACDVQIDISELCNDTPEHGYNAEIAFPAHTHPNVVFKDRNSYIHATPKLASSVVYPFAFIKPCGAHGYTTLKDINKRIHNPPTPKTHKEDNPSVYYPTSAFSGKPVVGKTKIHTEGGKGSITIMRTKG